MERILALVEKMNEMDSLIEPYLVNGGNGSGQGLQQTALSSEKQPCSKLPQQKATVEQIRALINKLTEMDRLIEPYLVKG